MEVLLADVVHLLVTVVEACGAAVIILGAVWAFARFLWLGLRRRDTEAFVPVRLTLGRFLALGLEFQLASDVLRTAVTPSARELAQLAAVATIRTALNYFLGRETAEERRQVARQKELVPAGAGPLSTPGVLSTRGAVTAHAAAVLDARHLTGPVTGASRGRAGESRTCPRSGSTPPEPSDPTRSEMSDDAPAQQPPGSDRPAALYRAAVTVRGGMAGLGRAYALARSDDGDLEVVVRPPRELGGPGGATTPEQLIAAGYAASFHEVLSLLAVDDHVDPSRLSVQAELSVGMDAAYGGHLLSAQLTVHWPGVGRRVAQDLIARAQERDPCSKMARHGLPSTTHLAEAGQ
jgi:Ohr subfamily peroxiredoxin